MEEFFEKIKNKWFEQNNKYYHIYKHNNSWYVSLTRTTDRGEMMNEEEKYKLLNLYREDKPLFLIKDNHVYGCSLTHMYMLSHETLHIYSPEHLSFKEEDCKIMTYSQYVGIPPK